MAITIKSVKGSPLTHGELDQNFIDLRDGVNLMVPKDAGKGLKVDSEGTPTFGWQDIHGTPLFNAADPLTPSLVTYRGGINQTQFAEGEQLTINFHMPHDYVPGTDLFIHAHWSHISTTLTGGSVTWAFETTYSKGFDQEVFTVPKTVSVVQNASTTQYQHMVAETALSVPGGSATQLNTADLEVDGVFITRMYLDSNDLTDSVSVPDPFIHFVDIHYQSSGVATKNRAPNFYGA